MKELIAKISHDYGQRPRKINTKYFATDDHARFLVSRGVAAYVEEKKPAPAAKAPVIQTATIKAEDAEFIGKRTYKRRDLTAEE